MYSLFVRFPFLRIVLYWVFGIVIADSFYHYSWPIFIAFVASAFVCFLFFPKQVLRLSFLLFCVFSGLSFFYNSSIFLKQNQPFNLNSQAFVFRVREVPQLKQQSWSLIGDITACKYSEHWKKSSGKLKIYIPIQHHQPQIGDEYLSIARIKPIASSMFPNEQNWKEYYQRKGIVGNVFLRGQDFIQLGQASPNFNFEQFFYQIQQRLKYHLNQTLKSERNREVASAMLLGARSSIDFETMQSYASLGAIHILSVSGMHVGLLYMGLSFIFGFLLKKGKWGTWLFFAFMMILLWLYAGISDFSAPVLRSAWMFSLMLFAKCFQFQQNTINILAFSCFILLVLDPNNLYQSGFQLSYLAVLGLLIYQSKFAKLLQLKMKNRLLNFSITQLWNLTMVAIAAQIFTLPLVIYYFHQIPHPFYFFLLNPFLILLSSISLCVGLLFVSVSELLFQFHWDWLYDGLGFLLDKSFDVLHALMFYVVKGVNPVIPFLQMEYWEMILCVCFLVMLEIWRHYRIKYLLYGNVVILLTLIFYHQYLIPRNISQQKLAYYAVYKKELVIIQIDRGKAFVFGSKNMINDGAWLQAHISPLCSYHHIRDTLVKQLRSNVNVGWNWKGKRFYYLQKPSEKWNIEKVDAVFLGANLKWKNAYWLSTWKGSNWYFVKTPSPYYSRKLAVEISENEGAAMALDTCIVKM
ncbi:ComEC/Rec2 family competence protein [Aquirufa sp. ROCK2-A2]